MANQLQINLNAILADKVTNLKPENLKQGITCLGIEGTLDTISNIHKYETYDDMPTTGTVGDICLVSNIKEVLYTVYGKENKFNYFYIPDTVTMPCYSDTDLTKGIFAKLPIHNGSIDSRGNASGNYILSYTTYGEMSPGGMGGPSNIMVDLLVEGTINTENKTITYKRSTNIGPFVKLPYSKYYNTDEAYLNSSAGDIDTGGIKLYHVSYNGTYMYDVNGSIVNLPKLIDTSVGNIVSGNKVETDRGIVEGTLTYKVTVSNGDTPADVKAKLKSAYEACNHIQLDITRSDDWANWTPIDIRSLSTSMSSSPYNEVSWLDIDIESGATLPSNKFFDLTTGMSISIRMSEIYNWSTKVDIGDLFIISESGPCGTTMQYVNYGNSGTVTQNIWLCMGTGVTVEADADTILHVAFGLTPTADTMLYCITNMCTSTNKSTLTVPTTLYELLTADQWKIATDKGWTVVKS